MLILVLTYKRKCCLSRSNAGWPLGRFYDVCSTGDHLSDHLPPDSQNLRLPESTNEKHPNNNEVIKKIFDAGIIDTMKHQDTDLIF